MAAPTVIKPIPNQVINERSAYGPLDLKTFIGVAQGDEMPRFSAGLVDGRGLPPGMICTVDGILTGIPAKGSEGNYDVMITAENASGKIDATFIMIIKPVITDKEGDYMDKLKSQVWQALEQKLPIPDLGELIDRPITALDIYYLLERWGALKIWDAYNLDPPGEPKQITLQGASKHYSVYDRGSCIVAVPKDLFSHERTIEDGLQTARAMAREVYDRKWTVELVGFEKLTRAAWIEIQHLGDKFGQKLDVINYDPSTNDIRLYSSQAAELSLKNMPE